MNEQTRQNPLRHLWLGALVALPIAAWAAPAVASPDAQADVASVAAPAAQRSPRIGVSADLGLPDGATLSVVYRPIRALRLHAGLSHNLISLGEQVGVTLVPLAWWASPTLSLDYGHFAEGNANPAVRRFSGSDDSSSPALDRVGYDYANARVGLELGRRWFTFYLHAGVSRISGTIHNLDAATMSSSMGTTSVSFPTDPTVRVWSVSASLGFVAYLAK
jgi:hypothetical protein